MSTEIAVEDSIERAATTVGSVWPLHSFVTANPLSGFEGQPFHESVQQASELLGGRGYPSADVFRAAYERDQIDRTVLAETLEEHGYEDDPEALLDRMAEAEEPADPEAADTPSDRVDAILSKWLAVFLDEGEAEWSMPNREDGFYAAFRSVARYDSEIPDGDAIEALPEEPSEAIATVLEPYDPARWEPIFEHQLTALPGWTGFIKQRADDGTDWQSAYPITLTGYLAVRLSLADLLGAAIEPPESDASETATDGLPLPEAWLRAWEATYRESIVDAVADAGRSVDTHAADGGRPDAQLVFCIDTRSEVIRRHVEDAGDYETHGYAGFFGVPMEYEDYDSGVSVEACPPIVDPQHRIEERPAADANAQQASRDRWSSVREAGTELIHTLESNAATAFGFVESTGSGYGAALAARTLLPARVYDLLDSAEDTVPGDHEFCEPSLDHDHSEGELPKGMTLEQKVEYAATAFELMGWESFGRLVVFTGHASQTANNPYDASLDCGACAGNPGGPSARVLATICNDESVRELLVERGFDIPEDTVFLGGQHNTTTDEVALYDGHVPESHEADLEALRADLETAREAAAAERAESMGADAADSVREAERRAADWAETRPEWGLAGNAGFVIGDPEVTGEIDFDGRSFLHSYDWSTDPDGDALEAIMAGPMVVTQWINCQYYFSTVDNAVYGSGSKITHNPVGNVGVYQGNGGDLMTGLPLQSLLAADDEPYHQPLRLSTVIQAPVERVTEILEANPDVAELLDNGWLSLTVVDPEQDHAAFHYDGELTWEPSLEAPTTETTTPGAAPADD